MKTITTKQLREDMSSVVQALHEGKPVRLSYRHRIIGTIRPHKGHGMPARRGSGKAVSEFISQTDFGLNVQDRQQSTKSLKEEIAELRTRDL